MRKMADSLFVLKTQSRCNGHKQRQEQGRGMKIAHTDFDGKVPSLKGTSSNGHAVSLPIQVLYTCEYTG